MTSFARRILAVLAISAGTAAGPVWAQSAYVSDSSANPQSTARIAKQPAHAQVRDTWQAPSYGARPTGQAMPGYGMRQAQMQSDMPAAQHAEASSSGWGDGGYEGSSDCGCGSGECDSCGCGCGSCGCGCSSHAGWYAGAELVWAQPFFQHNTALTLTSANSILTSSAALPFDYDYETTPRVVFGYENCAGLGVRARYWQFDHGAQPVSFDDVGDATATVNLNDFVGNVPLGISTDIGDTLSLTSGLELNVVDLEVTQRGRLGCTELVGSFGARYARIEQDLHAFITDANLSTVAALARIQSFEGVGLTTALDARRNLGGTNISAIGGVRGSILFGRRNITALEVFTGDGIDAFEFQRSEDEVIGVAEIMGGLEWSKCCCRGARLYVQAVVEGQLWEGVGNATDSDSNLGFFGYGFTVGVTH